LPENVAIEVPVVQYQRLLREAKTKMVQDAIRQAAGDHNEAAALLGMHPNNLRHILKNLGLRD
jgi:DNA-binding NtrC family response regulator